MEGKAAVMAGQLALRVKLRDDARFDNFHGERNAAAAFRLQESVKQSSVPCIVVCGDEDTGKSHLLQAVCHWAEEHELTAVCLSIEEILPFGPAALDGLEQFQRVCLDDLQALANKPDWEEAVFHLYNRIFDCGGQLVFSMTDLPGHLPFSLPDLVSRLRHGLLVQLTPQRDEDRTRILMARAEQRGLVLGEDVAAFILRRAPRRLADLLAILDQLDDNSLKAQRRLTIPFVKTVLDW